MLRAVLFDLDDTLFDHRHSRRCGLRALLSILPGLAPIEELEREHERLLQADYAKTLDRTVRAEDATAQRIRLLCGKYGVPREPPEAVDRYRDAYEKSRRPVPGAPGLLRRLKAERLKTGVITNGLREAQAGKLRACGLEDALDAVVISEEAGARKPDPKIFFEALRRVGAAPEEAVFIGDSWDSDVVGAGGCGIKAIWLNRYGLPRPGEGPAVEISSYEPVEGVVRIILGLAEKGI